MRRFRFTLRTMLVVTACVAVLLAWVVWNRRIVRERQALLKLGWDRVSYHHIAGTRVNVPEWMDSPESVIGAWKRGGEISTGAESFAATQGNSMSWLRRRMGDFPIVVTKTSE